MICLLRKLLNYKHYNLRGDVIVTTDSAGAVLSQSQYEAYGEHTDYGIMPSDKHRANTKVEDTETNLLLEGHRYRHLEYKTFMSPDPLEYVDGLNFYAYCGYNPWGRFDPYGLDYYRQMGAYSCVAATLGNLMIHQMNLYMSEYHWRGELEKAQVRYDYRVNPEGAAILYRGGVTHADIKWDNNDGSSRTNGGTNIYTAGEVVNGNYGKELASEEVKMNPNELVNKIQKEDASAMVNINYEGDRHAIMVEGVKTDKDGNTSVVVVDPARNLDPKDSRKVLPKEMSKSDFVKMAGKDQENGKVQAVIVKRTKEEKKNENND